MSEESGQFTHIPVLLKGVLEYLTFPADHPARLIDGTLGGAGHTSALLEKYPLLEVVRISSVLEHINIVIRFKHYRLTALKSCTYRTGNVSYICSYSK